MSRHQFLDEVIDKRILRFFETVETIRTGKVETYDSVKVRATIRLGVKKRLQGKFLQIPDLVNVPIMFPSSKKFSTTFPLEKDDTVIVFFAQSSIEEWVDGNDSAEPIDLREYSLSDAMAFPWTARNKTPISIADSANMVLGTTGGQIHIEPNGDIKLHSKTATQPFVNGLNLKTWAASVDAALVSLIAWSKTGTPPGPAGGIAPLLPGPIDPAFPASALSNNIKGK